MLNIDTKSHGLMGLLVVLEDKQTTYETHKHIYIYSCNTF